MLERKIEKQKFYLSEFQEEAAWLAFMHREGWKFISTNGSKYEFEKCIEEDWVYQLDFKENGIEDEDYIQMFLDYGWEYVGKYHKWFYFRKKKSGGSDDNISIFSDNESKIDMCKRIINGNLLCWIPFLLIILAYDYFLCFTTLFKEKGIISDVTSVIAIITIIAAIMGLGMIIGQYHRLNRLIKNMQND